MTKLGKPFASWMSARVLFALFSLVGAFACSLAAVGCSRETEGQKTQVEATVEYPLSLYDDTTVLTMHEGSKLSWILRTRRLVKHNRSDRIEAKPIDLRVYDSLGAEVMHVTSDSGTVDEAVTFLAAIGHVHGRSQKGLDITADSLRWNKAENRVSTESRVRVISEEGDTLRGKGFISDANLDNWQILSDVQGVFQKIEERVEQADKADATAQDSSGSAAGDTVEMIGIEEEPEQADSGQAIASDKKPDSSQGLSQDSAKAGSP